MRRRGLMVIVTAAGALLMLSSALSGADATRTVTLASHITIKSQELTFSGSVSSHNAECRRRRRVSLYRRLSQLLGSTTTNESGHWELTASGSAGISLGSFYARVKQRSEGTAGTIYICRAATSRTIPLNG